MKYSDFLREYLSEKQVEMLLKAQEKEPISCLRLNPLKYINNLDLDSLKAHSIVNNAFLFYKSEHKFGKNPLHEAGAYYIQEPSACLVGHLLDVNENDNVLDLCAAPGGKSTHVAPLLKNGFIISNDVNFSRSLDLLENVERLGIKNCFVLNEKINNIEKHFYGFFDKVILDAPCSGEGMFRKNENVKDDWSIEKVNNLSETQKQLIIQAYNCLKKDGILIYSTCTFNKKENEEVIRYLLESTNASLIKIDNYKGIDRGLDLEEAIRVFPFNFEGEGHFICKIKCNDEHPSYNKILNCKISDKNYKIYKDFESKCLNIELPKNQLFTVNNKLYFVPKNSVDFKFLNVLKYGLYIGEINTNYFVPSHHLASSLKKDDWKICLSYTRDDDRIKKYLKGEANFDQVNNQQGYGIICVENIPLGLIKITNNQIKNLYPKKLRKST